MLAGVRGEGEGMKRVRDGGAACVEPRGWNSEEKEGKMSVSEFL